MGGANKKARKYEAIIDEPEEVDYVPPEVEATPTCPKCSSDLAYLDLEIKKLWACKCGYRKKIK